MGSWPLNFEDRFTKLIKPKPHKSLEDRSKCFKSRLISKIIKTFLSKSNSMNEEILASDDNSQNDEWPSD